MPRLLPRLAVVLTTATALLTVANPAALAHVTAHSDDAEEGHSAEIAFRVPNENETTSTTKISLAMPTDKPIAEVNVLPLAGWTYHITKTPAKTSLSTEDGDEVSEVVSQVDWQATSPETEIKPGEYQVFRIVAGPLPRTEWLVFKVIQTYNDGQTQRWIDDPLEDGEEPAHPAALLPVTGNTGGHSHNQPTTVIPAANAQSETPSTMWWAAITIAMVALLAALASVVISIRTTKHPGGEAPPG